MFLYQVFGTRYSAKSTMTANIQVKDESSSIQVDLNAQEIADLEALANRVYARHQAALIEKMRKPLETNLLAAPTSGIIDADFAEVNDDGGPF